eukprot:TRINITY_DN8620_c0_g1_i2.p1 TRINITY_DN8620_c0_g1~~TRINITY_DN8620_c0_g1_i2.p1  ORF type:complete len:227 (+),score=36.62 TRINITY_DN8620_c0_g1_i2:97-681(+)
MASSLHSSCWPAPALTVPGTSNPAAKCNGITAFITLSGSKLTFPIAGARTNNCCIRRRGIFSELGAGRDKKLKQGAEADPVPAWAQPGSDEAPPWERTEKSVSPPGSSSTSFEIPFWAFLISSTLVGIATVGSIFEFFNHNPIFGVVPPESPLWAPILGFFALTGFPSTIFLLVKAIQGANKAAEEVDRQDGYM